MTKTIFDAYRNDGWHIFALYKTSKGKTGNAVKGLYGTPTGWNDTSKTYEWNKDAVYGGVPPEGMVAIDWDVKNDKKGKESFIRLQKDIGTKLNTCVSTPSGGGHAYVKFDGKLLKKLQDKYPDIDFQSHGKEFVALGGQSIEGYGEYAFVDEIEDYFTNNADLSSLQVRGDTPIVVEEELDDGLLVADGKRHIDDIAEMLNNLDPSVNRDTWMQLLASAYNIAIDKKGVRDVCLEWSKKGENYSDEGFEQVWTQIANGTWGTTFKGGMLVKLSYENKDNVLDDKRQEKYDRYVESIKSATSLEEVKDLFKTKDWKSEPLCSKAQQKTLPSICANKVRDIFREQGNEEKVYVEEFKFLLIEEPKAKKKKVDLKDTTLQTYMCDNKYQIVKDMKLIEEQFKQSLYTLGINFGFDGDDFENHVKNKSQIIQGIKKETDYMIKDEVKYTLRNSANPSEFDYLHVLTNPFHNIDGYIDRQDIIDDFCHKIWKGKAEDVVRLIGLTIRFKETKLNKIHLVGPSNIGKTTYLENIGFQTIHMKRLVQALNADKGIGKNVIDGLKSSGFLLIDEANDPLTQDIKNIDNYIQLDQFGQGGTQDIKLHYTVLTSTHKNAIRNMSDEMYNRLLIIELGKDELDYTLDKSELFVHDTDNYSKVLTSYFKWLLKDTLTNPKYRKQHLLDLQNKYRLELNSDINDMLCDISERIVDTLKTQADTQGDVLLKNGDYYIKRKKDLVGMIEDLLSEHGNIDVGKYSDTLVQHFLSSPTTKTVKVNGKPVKYYPLSLTPYYESEEDEIIARFDDLDEEDDLDEF